MEEILNKISLKRANWIFLIDASKSMTGKKIEQVKKYMLEITEKLAKKSHDDMIDIMVRVIKYDSSPTWIVGDIENGVNINDLSYDWENLTTGGMGNTALAIEECMKSLNTKYLGLRSQKPVVVLLSDINTSDKDALSESIEKLKKTFNVQGNKEKVIRVAIDLDITNRDALESFASEGYFCDENIKLIFGTEDFSFFNNLFPPRDLIIPPYPLVDENDSEPQVIIADNNDSSDWDW